jgi:hypothetical protein
VFTLEQIEEPHGRLGSAETPCEYVRSLAALGVARYDSFVSDGRSEYTGRDAHRPRMIRAAAGCWSMRADRLLLGTSAEGDNRTGRAGLFEFVEHGHSEVLHADP